MNIEKAKKKFYNSLALTRAIANVLNNCYEFPEYLDLKQDFRFIELLCQMLACGCQDVNFETLAKLGLLAENDWKYFEELIVDEMPDVKSWKQLKKMYEINS